MDRRDNPLSPLKPLHDPTLADRLQRAEAQRRDYLSAVCEEIAATLDALPAHILTVYQLRKRNVVDPSQIASITGLTVKRVNAILKELERCFRRSNLKMPSTLPEGS